VRQAPRPIGSCARCFRLVYRTAGFVEVTGWAPSRAAGGTNQVRRAVTTGKVLCPECNAELDLEAGIGVKVHPDQTELFADG
jgi:hypothetical protein